MGGYSQVQQVDTSVFDLFPSSNKAPSDVDEDDTPDLEQEDCDENNEGEEGEEEEAEIDEEVEPEEDDEELDDADEETLDLEFGLDATPASWSAPAESPKQVKKSRASQGVKQVLAREKTVVFECEIGGENSHAVKWASCEEKVVANQVVRRPTGDLCHICAVSLEAWPHGKPEDLIQEYEDDPQMKHDTDLARTVAKSCELVKLREQEVMTQQSVMLALQHECAFVPIIALKAVV